MCLDDSVAVDFLVDDPGYALDLSEGVAEVFAKVFPADHEARLAEAVRLAGSPDLPTFLRRTGGYTVWLASPRLSRGTLFRVGDELKRQKPPFETRKLTSLKQNAGPNRAPARRRHRRAVESRGGRGSRAV